MWFLASPKQEEKKSPQGKQTPSQGQDKHPKMRKRRGFLERWEDITYILDIQLHLHLSLFFAFFLIVSDISLSLFSLYITTSVLLQSLSSELTGLCMIQDLDHFYSDWFHPLSITLCLFLMDLFFFYPGWCLHALCVSSVRSTRRKWKLILRVAFTKTTSSSFPANCPNPRQTSYRWLKFVKHHT